MSLFPGAPAQFLPARSVGPFTAQVTVSEVATDTLTITSHPVQDGVAISDHAWRTPEKVTLEIMFDGRDGRTLQEIYQDLLTMQRGLIPFDVVTGKRAYRNMMAQSIVQTTNAQMENVLSLQVDIQEVLTVGVSRVRIPPRESQADPASTGAVEATGRKAPEQTTPARSSSALSALFA